MALMNVESQRSRVVAAVLFVAVATGMQATPAAAPHTDNKKVTS
ncbi:MAG: hypothetical protein JWM82_2202 [Myxococcales bacterium]|nr:hypothetical protein [Myxococcales bacterium]